MLSNTTVWDKSRLSSFSPFHLPIIMDESQPNRSRRFRHPQNHNRAGPATQQPLPVTPPLTRAVDQLFQDEILCRSSSPFNQIQRWVRHEHFPACPLFIDKSPKPLWKSATVPSDRERDRGVGRFIVPRLPESIFWSYYEPKLNTQTVDLSAVPVPKSFDDYRIEAIILQEQHHPKQDTIPRDWPGLFTNSNISGCPWCQIIASNPTDSRSQKKHVEGSFLLCRLPRELRDAIYEFALPRDLRLRNVLRESLLKRPLNDEVKQNDYFIGNLALLLANKQVSREASIVFLHSNCFIFDFVDFLPCLPPSLCCLSNIKRLEVDCVVSGLGRESIMKEMVNGLKWRRHISHLVIRASIFLLDHSDRFRPGFIHQSFLPLAQIRDIKQVEIRIDRIIPRRASELSEKDKKGIEDICRQMTFPHLDEPLRIFMNKYRDVLLSEEDKIACYKRIHSQTADIVDDFKAEDASSSINSNHGNTHSMFGVRRTANGNVTKTPTMEMIARPPPWLEALSRSKNELVRAISLLRFREPCVTDEESAKRAPFNTDGEPSKPSEPFTRNMESLDSSSSGKEAIRSRTDTMSTRSGSSTENKSAPLTKDTMQTQIPTAPSPIPHAHSNANNPASQKLDNPAPSDSPPKIELCSSSILQPFQNMILDHSREHGYVPRR